MKYNKKEWWFLMNRSLHELLQQMPVQITAPPPVLLGLDGFIDEIVWPVRQRMDNSHFERIEYMNEFGQIIMNAAGLSTNIEMVTRMKKLGGNGPILANALQEYGIMVDYIGMLGEPSINPVFNTMKENMNIISIGEPGHTDAIEFLDGKIISSKTASFDKISWKTLKTKVGIEKLKHLMKRSAIIGFENWSMIMNMTEIWQGIITDILPGEEKHQNKIMFIDLADPKKRSAESLRKAMKSLQTINEYYKVVLGLNEKEAVHVLDALGISDTCGKNIQELASLIMNELRITNLVVHSVKSACSTGEHGNYMYDGPYCSNPKLSTGAGDNFNAGYLLGRILNIDSRYCILLGMASSGYYVRYAKSPKYNEVISFIKDWINDFK